MSNNNNGHIFLVLAAVSGFLAVFAGAFGAHMMEQFVGPQRLDVWETAVRYQFYHTLMLFFSILLYRQQPVKLLTISAWCFVGGMVIFSGSLYLLVLLDMPVLGMITPVGGLLLLAGWALLAAGIWGLKSND